MAGVYIQRESYVQRHGKLFARDAILDQHEFIAFEASRKSSVQAWTREKAKGVRKSTPDSVTCVVNLPPIWFEWKAPGKEPRQDQYEMGDALMALGHNWAWGDSVMLYREALLRFGVRLAANSEFLALHHNGQALALIAKEELKRGTAPKSYRPRAVKASAGAVRRVSKLRSSVMF